MGKRRRQFDVQFKIDIMLELLSERATQAELCRKHQLSPTLLAKWKEMFFERLSVVFEPDEQHQELLHHVEELEQLVGRLTLELEILKKASSLVRGRRSNNGRS